MQPMRLAGNGELNAELTVKIAWIHTRRIVDLFHVHGGDWRPLEMQGIVLLSGFARSGSFEFWMNELDAH